VRALQTDRWLAVRGSDSKQARLKAEARLKQG